MLLSCVFASKPTYRLVPCYGHVCLIDSIFNIFIETSAKQVIMITIIIIIIIIIIKIIIIIIIITIIIRIIIIIPSLLLNPFN